MDAVIVDTNVIVIANDTDDKRKDCRDHCQNRIKQIRYQREKVVIDDSRRILREYDKNTHPNTKKGIGDLFVKRLLQNQKNPKVCTMVPITSLAGNGTDFEEFPDDNALINFDPDDRKFIAVALAHKRDNGQVPTILLAIDRGWLQFMAALANHGVSVDLICEEDMQRPRQRRKEG
ncbi:hypothetical protein F4054_18535 [Candidatus Poribacteria bacterium]|nr:hypothetical protein [Candidatus Poribacteria bacterium]MYG06270.1 hypothetical protein [Candidatus Poribacteria bacterium]MYK24242.1 hypothetical protein [Candidatus Poribacteria bacterium]